MEGLAEQVWEEQQGGPLIEPVAIRGVHQAAAAAGEVVLLEDGDVEAGFGEAGGGCYAACSGAWIGG